MKLKNIVSHLLASFACALFLLQVNSLVFQRIATKTIIDPQIGDDSGKGPPGINRTLSGLQDPAMSRC